MDVAASLLCEATRLANARADRLERFAAATDWTDTLARARDCAILPTLAWTLAHHRITSMPPEVAEALSDAIAQNTAQNALLLVDLGALASALESANVAFVVLKGGALLVTNPLAVSIRHTDDIDLLLDPVEVPRVERIAQDLGYVVAPRRERLDHHGGVVGHEFHLVQLVSPSGTPVELHHRAGWTVDVGLASQREVRRARVRGRDVTVPSSESLARQLSRHVLLQHAADPRLLLRHLVDLALLEWPEVADPTVWLSKRLADALTLSPDSITRRATQALLFGATSLTLERMLRPVFLAATMDHYGATAWIRRLFPSRAYLAQSYPEAVDASPRELFAIHRRRWRDRLL